MIYFRDECCGCAAPGYPCIAPRCKNLHVPVCTCDRCGWEVEDLYEVDGMEVCLDCAMETLPYDEERDVYDVDGREVPADDLESFLDRIDPEDY